MQQLVKTGKVAGYKIRHANMVLMAEADGPAMTDQQISKALGVSVGQMEHLRKRLVEQRRAARWVCQVQVLEVRLP